MLLFCQLIFHFHAHVSQSLLTHMYTLSCDVIQVWNERDCDKEYVKVCAIIFCL